MKIKAINVESKMKKKVTNGLIIIAIGVIHTLLTPLAYLKQFQVFTKQYFFSINGGFLEKTLNYETFAAFWCLYFGLILFPLGILLHTIERKGVPIPFAFIISYLIFILVGVYMIPMSGMTIFMLPHAIYMTVKYFRNSKK